MSGNGERSGWRHTFYGLADVTAFLRRRIDERTTYGRPSNGWAGIDSWDECLTMIEDGWPEGLEQAMPIAQQALTYVNATHELRRFPVVADVAGGSVCIPEYLQGVPTCMRYRKVHKISEVGAVVTLCAGVCNSGATSTEDMMRHGAAVLALTMALEQCGHGTELWVDSSFGDPSIGEAHNSVRVRVKAPGEFVDPARIAFTFAHPAMLRAVGFEAWHASPARYYLGKGEGDGTGAAFTVPADSPCVSAGDAFSRERPDDPMWRYNYPADLAPGTIYLPALASGASHDDMDPVETVVHHLRQLGLITD